MGIFMPRLRDSIRLIHDEAEKRGPLGKIVENTMTSESYVSILCRLYGFVTPCEVAMDPLLKVYGVEIRWNERKRADLLKKDLMFFGMSDLSIESIPKCYDVYRMDTTADALGLAYILEGSRLGGLTLSKALQKNFGFQNHQGYSYFSSNGVDVINLWSSFRDFMENYVALNDSGQEIIAAAISGFQKLNSWLDVQEVEPAVK